MTFGFLLFNDLEELDLIGPWEMITMWGKHAGGPEHCVMIAENMKPIICAKGLSVNPHTSFADCPELDYLLIPGGQGTRVEVDNPKLIEFVANQAKSCQAMLSVCTGSFILHKAGLLSGKRATTHWRSLPLLRGLGDVQVVEQRFVQDGNIWTAAGVSAGIDMALAFIATTAGERAAMVTQLAAEYVPDKTIYGDLSKVENLPEYIK